MKRERKRYSSEFKAKLALEVVKEQRTLNEIARDSGVHPTQLLQWKKQLLENLPSMFADKRCKAQQEQAAHEAHLYQEIGQLKVELDCAQGAPEKKAGLLTGR